VVGEEADVHEDGLVLCGGAREGVGVEHLPCHGSVAVKSHVRAVALAGAVPQFWEPRAVGAGSALLGLLPWLALFQLCPHHSGGLGAVEGNEVG